MRTLTIMWLSMVTGCTGASVAMDTTTVLAHETIEETPEIHLDVCDTTSAHITRARLGNRPIVIDGVTYYCF